MHGFSTAYLILASLLIAACAWVFVRRQRGGMVSNRVLLPFVLALNTVALGGLWIANHEFLAHWLGGEEVSFGIRTPFRIPAPTYYLCSLAVTASPVLMLLPPIIGRPWLVASLGALATFPITYSALSPGC